MKIKLFQFIDILLLLCVVSLSVFGIVFIYSAGLSNPRKIGDIYTKQIVWASIGFVFMLLFAFFDYRKLFKWAKHLFVLTCLVLIFTRLFGVSIKGAKSWIGFHGLGVQPSEFSKIIFTIFLAWYLTISRNENPLIRFLISCGIALIPVGLIMLQPDLGTSLVFFPILIFMMYMGGIHKRFIFMLLLFVMFTSVFTVLPMWEVKISNTSVQVIHLLTNTKLRLLLVGLTGFLCVFSIVSYWLFNDSKYFYWIAYFSGIICVSLVASYAAGKFLKEYQIMRLIIFINPYSDPTHHGWNILNSLRAIGNGGTRGWGVGLGPQSQHGYLPEQHTDFIFSILSEEMGFFGSLLIFMIYLAFFLRIVYIIRNSTNEFGTLIAAGLLAMFFFHFVENIGMVMGVMPITGIPLMFLSYGGSSLWTAMISVGLIMSIRSRKYDF